MMGVEFLVALASDVVNVVNPMITLNFYKGLVVIYGYHMRVMS